MGHYKLLIAIYIHSVRYDMAVNIGTWNLGVADDLIRSPTTL